jgi:DNA repair exonuclease SbcCD ATPase subunit
MHTMQIDSETIRVMEQDIQKITTEVKGIKDDIQELSTGVAHLNTDIKLIENSLQQYNKILEKLDHLTNGIEKIVTIHNEKIINNEHCGEAMSIRMSNHMEYQKSLYDKLEAKDKTIEAQVHDLEKFKWTLVGIFSAISVIISFIAHLLEK